MARKSAAALTIVRSAPAPKVPKGPPAPKGLSKAERKLWREIVDTKPADWWGPDSLPILTEYVRAITMCDTLAEKIETAMKSNVAAGQVKLLMDLRDKESRRAVSLATKMRLTQQSRYGARSADRANNAAAGKRPWHS